MDIGSDKAVREILSRLRSWKAGDGPVRVDGTWGSFAPMLAGYISGELKRPILYVSAHIDDADNVGDDISVVTGRGVETFPVWEGGEGYSEATDEIGAARLRTALFLAEGAGVKDFSGLIISTGVQALNQPVPGVEVVKSGGLELSTGQVIEPELVLGCWRHDRPDLRRRVPENQ